MGSQESQPRSRRTGSPTALAATSARPPGGSGCTAGDVAGSASAPGTSSRDAPRSAPRTQLSLLCHPQIRRQCRCSCYLGHPGYCSGRAIVPALREKRPSPRVRRCGGPGRPAPRRGGARRHREKFFRGAEAVGGGRRRWVGEAIALLSPESKVLGTVSRARSLGSRGCLLRARAGLSLRETRQPSASLVAAAPAPGLVRLGAGRGDRTLDPPRGGGADPGPRRPLAPGSTHRSRGTRFSVIGLPKPRARGSRRTAFPPQTLLFLLLPLPCLPPAFRQSLYLLRSPAAVGSPGSQRLID